MNLWLGIATLVAAALAFLVVPWWRHRFVAGQRGWRELGLLAALPAVTAGLYLYLGAPDILREQALTEAQARYDADAMLVALETKLKKEPDDVEGWYALGRAYIAFERLPEAEAAMAKAAALAPADARILAQYAEAIALRTGSLTGRPLELVKAALEIDYEEEKALELAGLAAYQQEKWAESLHYWRRLLKKLPKDTDAHDAISQAVRIAAQKVETAMGR